MATGATQRSINAIVVSAGLMQKTVKVRIGTQEWNSHIRKHFNCTKNVLVHDPRSSLRLGDVVAIESGWRVSKHVRHVVARIIAPFGVPIEARPPVPTFEERMGERERRRAEKVARREARRGGAEGLEDREVGWESVGGQERDAVVREAREAEVA